MCGSCRGLRRGERELVEWKRRGVERGRLQDQVIARDGGALGAKRWASRIKERRGDRSRGVLRGAYIAIRGDDYSGDGGWWPGVGFENDKKYK